MELLFHFTRQQERKNTNVRQFMDMFNLIYLSKLDQSAKEMTLSRSQLEEFVVFMFETNILSFKLSKRVFGAKTIKTVLELTCFTLLYDFTSHYPLHHMVGATLELFDHHLSKQNKSQCVEHQTN